MPTEIEEHQPDANHQEADLPVVEAVELVWRVADLISMTLIREIFSSTRVEQNQSKSRRRRRSGAWLGSSSSWTRSASWTLTAGSAEAVGAPFGLGAGVRHSSYWAVFGPGWRALAWRWFIGRCADCLPRVLCLVDKRVDHLSGESGAAASAPQPPCSTSTATTMVWVTAGRSCRRTRH